MSLETGEYISDLDPNNPLGSDPKSQGDDHMRLIKKTTQQSWPLIDGAVQISASAFNAMIGAYMDFAYPVPASQGWLFCDGSAVSRTDYPVLFANIGTIYGAGDGSTTFNLPDFRGQFARAWDNGAGNDPDVLTRGDRGDGTTGDVIGTTQIDQFKSHNHSHNYTTFTEDGSSSEQREPSNGAGPYVTGYAGGNETRPKNINVGRYILAGVVV